MWMLCFVGVYFYKSHPLYQVDVLGTVVYKRERDDFYCYGGLEKHFFFIFQHKSVSILFEHCLIRSIFCFKINKSIIKNKKLSVIKLFCIPKMHGGHCQVLLQFFFGFLYKLHHKHIRTAPQKWPLVTPGLTIFFFLLLFLSVLL